MLLKIIEDLGQQEVSLAQARAKIDRMIPRSELAIALKQLDKLVPYQDDGDNDAEWQAELVKRYGSVTSFRRMLARLELGAVNARASLLAADKGLLAWLIIAHTS